MGSSPNVGWASLLEDSLLPQLFPSQRIVLGMRVSKTLRKRVIENATQVLLQEQTLKRSAQDGAAINGTIEWTTVLKDLDRFEHAAVRFTLKLRSLSLFTQLRCQEAEALAQQAKRIVRFDLRDIHLDPLELNVSIVQALTVINHQFRLNELVLVLVKCNLGPNGIGAMPEDSLCQIRVLDVGCNKLRAAGAECISKLLHCFVHMEELNIRCNAIGDHGVRHISEHLRSISTLKVLNLNCNRISTNGARELASTLHACPGLVCLQIAKNQFGNTGAEVLARALRSLSTIQGLHLQRNCIGDSGAAAVVGNLSELPVLSHINLSLNQVGDDGARSIAQILPRFHSLRSLNLSLNQMTVVGESAVIARALSNVHVDIRANATKPTWWRTNCVPCNNPSCVEARRDLR